MYQAKLMKKQIETSGLRLGDSCRIYPCDGRKKSFTLNRNCIDIVSNHFRPADLSMSYIELPKTQLNPFHYRLELDNASKEGRFILKTLTGNPYWINGTAAREAYVERMDRLYIDENKINFDPFELDEVLNRHYEHPILMDHHLINSELKILIQGETGTGKSHLAAKIHQSSGRLGKFVGVNLSSFNPLLIESELFGHKKGAFTGAISEKEGAFVEAENGTLFLDEIDSLPLDIQTKLLTFLDNHRFRKVGDTRERGIKARLIFASGRKLESLVQTGEMRKDFYYRLKSGHSLELSPLRNDTNKISEACQYFSLKHSVVLSQRLKDFYQTLAWPGNLRQLFGHLEKKKILTRTTKLDFDHLDQDLLEQSSDLMDISIANQTLSLNEVKLNYIKKVVSECDGNVSQAAKKLKVNEKTIRSTLQEFNLQG